MHDFSFHLPTKVVFGSGSLSELGHHVGPGVERVLVVTDRGVAEHSDALASIGNLLREPEVNVFSDVEPNPSYATLVRASSEARERGAELVVGLGGGSPMDAAKGVALLSTNRDGVEILKTGAVPVVKPLPLVCIPTTSGTGSEVTPYAVFTDPDGECKIGYGHPSLFPTLSIVDPDLSASMPDEVIVNTGLDALTHAVEAFISTESSPMSDLFAVQTIETVRDSLPSAATRDPEAMAAMAWAAMLAGVAITHAGTTLLHVMGYPLTVYHGLPHGRASVCMLPQYLDFLKKQDTVTEKIGRIESIFERVDGVAGLLHSLGVSTALSDYGVEPEEIPTFVDKVITKDDLRITPAEVGRDEIASIYRAAFESK